MYANLLLRMVRVVKNVFADHPHTGRRRFVDNRFASQVGG
jgi:hypothetical protein